jgi:hypothetical protein
MFQRGGRDQMIAPVAHEVARCGLVLALAVAITACVLAVC